LATIFLKEEAPNEGWIGEIKQGDRISDYAGAALMRLWQP
jgi:hypothetical protein